MATKKEILEEIERVIDHYTPYRPVLDSKHAVEVRVVLNELLNFAKRGN